MESASQSIKLINEEVTKKYYYLYNYFSSLDGFLLQLMIHEKNSKPISQ